MVLSSQPHTMGESYVLPIDYSSPESFQFIDVDSTYFLGYWNVNGIEATSSNGIVTTLASCPDNAIFSNIAAPASSGIEATQASSTRTPSTLPSNSAAPASIFSYTTPSTIAPNSAASTSNTIGVTLAPRPDTTRTPSTLPSKIAAPASNGIGATQASSTRTLSTLPSSSAAPASIFSYTTPSINRTHSLPSNSVASSNGIGATPAPGPCYGRYTWVTSILPKQDVSPVVTLVGFLGYEL
jgi:hypothetical protein